MAEVEVIDRVERRRKWSEAEKAALLAEVEAAGGKVARVARRHRISESLLYNWRAAVRVTSTIPPHQRNFLSSARFGHSHPEASSRNLSLKLLILMLP